ncbi:LysR family transcriptional regulator substrate-binding protein [Delftia tsuruhatensis]|uniref:LysR family transcriptional regulator substrate-binding protein n=2 Tax=Pseudomonadota TaxID=1224 RepID=UPI0009BBE8F8|nr:LysR family transcriptional regulator substrate-binding protein [Delftia tsuruhatensis]
MARTTDEIGLAAELWSPLLKQRFETLFAVASRKSLRGWRQVPLVSAQVLVVDGSLPVPEAAGWLPCVVYVGGVPQGQHLERTPQRLATYLDLDFTLSDLIDMLDRAAVFLMDWTVRQQVASSQTLVRALDDLRQQAEGCRYQFRLKAWVALPAPWNSAESLRALAMLCRGPMDVATLCEHSGMAPAAVAELLRRRPGLRVRLTVGKSDDLERALLDGSLDLAVVPSYPGHATRCAQVVIGEDELWAAARPRHPLFQLALEQGLRFGHLQGYSWALPAPGAAVRKVVDEAFAAQGLGAPTVALEIQHNTEATIDIVGQTDLLCYVPSHVLRSNPERLQSLPIPELRTRRSWLLISHPKAHWSPLMSALRDLTLG